MMNALFFLYLMPLLNSMLNFLQQRLFSVIFKIPYHYPHPTLLEHLYKLNYTHTLYWH